MESMVGFKVMMSKIKGNTTSIVSHVSMSALSALLLAGCLTATSLANAEDSSATSDTTEPAAQSKGMMSSAGAATLDYFGFNHTRVDDLHGVYVGLGSTNSLLHFYADVPTEFGHVYAKVGQFFEGNEIAGQVGFRMPYNYESAKNNNGLYFGAYAGHIENSSIGTTNERKNRLGAALEMSYLFLNKTSLTAASVSIGGAQTEETGNANQQKITPMIMFGLSWGYGLF